MGCAGRFDPVTGSVVGMLFQCMYTGVFGMCGVDGRLGVCRLRGSLEWTSGELQDGKHRRSLFSILRFFNAWLVRYGSMLDSRRENYSSTISSIVVSLEPSIFLRELPRENTTLLGLP